MKSSGSERSSILKRSAKISAITSDGGNGRKQDQWNPGRCGKIYWLVTYCSLTAADAAGWGSIHRYVKPSGNCAGQEVLASYYWTGRRTASGERFDASGNTAAARTWPLGARLTVTNPHNGRSVTVRINDTGPWGIAYRMGARLDLARGAAMRLGMHGSQYVCVA